MTLVFDRQMWLLQPRRPLRPYLLLQRPTNSRLPHGLVPKNDLRLLLLLPSQPPTPKFSSSSSATATGPAGPRPSTTGEPAPMTAFSTSLPVAGTAPPPFKGSSRPPIGAAVSPRPGAGSMPHPYQRPPEALGPTYADILASQQKGGKGGKGGRGGVKVANLKRVSPRARYMEFLMVPTH